MTRTAARALWIFVTPVLCACSGGSGAVEQSSSAVAPPLPISWTQPAWFIDPANSTGAASDSNTCTSVTKPCLTYAGVVQIWGGTTSPRLRQNTTITFLSSQWNDGDPVDVTPYVENGATVTLQGALGAEFRAIITNPALRHKTVFVRNGIVEEAEKVMADYWQVLLEL